VIYLLDIDHKKLKYFIQDMSQASVKFLCGIYVTMGLSGHFAIFYISAEDSGVWTLQKHSYVCIATNTNQPG